MLGLAHASGGVIKHISSYHAELSKIRRDLHANPELGFEEVRTGGIVAGELQAYKVDHIQRGLGKTGVVAVIKGKTNRSGKTIGLRADMDALPMTEENEFDHISATKGLMHGCGHDGHTTMLLGAAKYLAATRNFDGTVHCIFQPGEEGYAGARAMIQDGLFDQFPCDTIYAMHNWPNMPPGKIGITPGAAMAAADRVTITINGRGGHGAHAYHSVDPVVIAAQVITALQTIVSRNVSPIESAVISICALHAGNLNAMSVIPRQAQLVGTVRTFNSAIQDMVEQRIKAIASGIAQAMGGSADINYERIYPATINSAAEASFAAATAEELIGAENVVRDLPPSMGAEDFSFMLQVRPGAYLRIGQGGTEGCFLHNTKYDFNDAIIPLGSALFARLAERSLPQ